jgi:hypothetical protein
MQTQWYLCEIENYSDNQGNYLKKTDNLSVQYPNIFCWDDTAVEDNKKGEGLWYVWLPIIPRVGDTLQFAAWQVQVSKVILATDWHSETGIKEGLFVSAWISILLGCLEMIQYKSKRSTFTSILTTDIGAYDPDTTSPY